MDEKLTEASVLEEARRRTGLDELGDEHFLVPLRRLLEGLRAASGVSSTTRFLVRGSLIHFVSNRMRIHDAVTRDPSIRERPVTRPIVVTGVPRTGTTLLHNLLAQAPDARPLRFFETLSPVPAPGDDQSARIRRAELLVKMTRKFSPEMARAHALDPHGPEECLGLLQNTFTTPFMTPFLDRGLLPYRTWLEGLDREARDRSYREYRLQLQILGEGTAPRWFLKCPCHLFGLGSLLRVLPDAAVVHTHRDPRESVPSLCSLRAKVEGMGAQVASPLRIGRNTLELVDDLLRWSAEGRDGEGSDRIVDVTFDALMADPVGTAEGVLRHAGYPTSPELRRRMEAWLEDNPRDKHGRHRYTATDFGLDEAEIAERLGWYYDRFDVGVTL